MIHKGRNRVVSKQPFLVMALVAVLAVISFLDTEATVYAQSPAEGEPESAGDADRGENLFTGPNRFENRGPSCSACHSSSGIGALGGGTLGPDLTGTYAKLGDAMITWPANFDPMKPIYSKRPLTEQEKADLLAFFKSADVTEREVAQVVQLFGLAVAGVVVIAVFTHLIWRRRLRGVRRPLVGTGALASEPQGNKLKRLLNSLLWEQSTPSSRR